MFRFNDGRPLMYMCMHIVSDMSNVHAHTIETRCGMFDQVLDQTIEALN